MASGIAVRERYLRQVRQHHGDLVDDGRVSFATAKDRFARRCGFLAYTSESGVAPNIFDGERADGIHKQLDINVTAGVVS